MRKTLTNIFLRWLTLAVFLSVLGTGSAWFLDTYTHYRKDILDMRHDYMEKQRSQIQERVDQAITHISYMRSNLTRLAEGTVQERTDTACMIISGLTRNYNHAFPKQILAELVRDSLSNIRFPGQEHYFAMKPDGSVEFFTDRSDAQSSEHIPVEILKHVNPERTVLHTYADTRPGQGDQLFPKVIAIRYIPELDWIIGTGIYIDKMEQTIKENALDWLDQVRLGNDKKEYLFAGTWKGKSLSGPAKGKNMLSITDLNGVRIVEELIQKARDGGGFVEYVMPKFKTGRPVPKLSYSAPINDWQWYIGTGKYIDEIEVLIDNRRQELETVLIRHIYQIGGLLLLLGSLCMLMLYLMGKRLKRNVEPLTAFFNRAAKDFEQIDEKQLDFEEFRLVAENANTMLREQKRTQKLLSSQEHLLSSLTHASHCLLSGNDINRAIKKTLSILGHGCSVQRVSLFEMERGKRLKNTINLHFEWTDNVAAKLNDPRFQNIHPATFTNGWLQDFLSGKAFQGTPEDFPPEAAGVMEEYKIKTTLLLPIIYRDRLWGALCLDACQQNIEFSDHTIGSLLNFASSLCTAISQRRSEYDAIKIRNLWVSTFDSIADAIFVLDENCRLLDANQSALTIAEIDSINTIRGRHISTILHGEMGDPDKCLAERSLQENRPFMEEVHSTLLHKTYLSSAFPMKQKDNSPSGVIFIARDVTKEKNLEKQIAQTQKMEAIGVLAGGIAHDFNNILAAIMGFTELAQIKVQQERTKGLDKDLDQIFQAGERAKDLVKQLLAFSRNQDADQTPISVIPILKETIKMLQAFLPASIQTTTTIGAETRKTLANGTALHQVFMNLGNNAAQAMEKDGGELQIVFEEIEAGPEQSMQFPVDAKHYLHIAFHDQGGGIDPQILSKIYDPFFTTKKPGDGTGMGLAAVHGIIEAHNGFIKLDNNVGKGASFHIYLPQSNEPVDNRPQLAIKADLQQAHYKTILVVDDEEMLLTMYRDIFTLLGCTPIVANRPGKALKLLEEHPEIDLLCTDMNMPEMNGLKLARRCHAIRPDLPVLLCSGLTVNLKQDELLLAGINAIVDKPLTLQGLLDTLNSGFTSTTEPVL